MASRKSTLLVAFSLTIGIFFAGASFAADQPARGGTLRYAMIDTPPTLDQHVVTATLGTTISQHFFETLFAFTEAYEPVPFLAESADVQDDGKLIVLALRKGVLFHNGKELSAEDVIASLDRWFKHGVRGPIVGKHVEKMEADGKYGVRLYLKEPFAPWATMLAFANGGPVIYPKEVAEAAGKEPIPMTNYIGTGPYRFVEWKAGHAIILERFDQYVNRSEKGNGYAGARNAYFDKIMFIPVADPGTRVNGLRAGDYDYAEMIPGDLFEELDKDPAVRTMIRKAAGFGGLFCNQKEGMMTNQKLRQAVLAAINMEPVLRAAVGPKKLWALNGALMPPGTKWHTTAGTEAYSQGDPEKAKALAKEAGYNGEQIKYMVTTSYDTHYNSSVVIAKQLKDAGFNIDLQIYDWATLVSRRTQSKLWDLFFTTHGFVPDPMLWTFMSSTYPGWWDTESKRKYSSAFTVNTDPAKRMEAMENIQKTFYDEVPLARTGDMFTYDIYSPNVQGVGSESLLNFNKFWNVWFKK